MISRQFRKDFGGQPHTRRPPLPIKLGAWKHWASGAVGGVAVAALCCTHTGTVTAASDWDALPERKRVLESLPGSVERLLHDTGMDRFLVSLRDGGPVADALREPRLERAIGVIYRPETERASHYFEARLSDQFDAVLHYDHTRAVEPLERTVEWETAIEPPETYPTGF